MTNSMLPLFTLLFAFHAYSQNNTSSSNPIVIAIIDTGLNLQDERFQNFLWQNPGESGIDKRGRDKRFNKIDDDGNGYIDDVHGFDFTKNSATLTDTHGHGTHIAGLVAGISPAVASLKNDSAPIKIMILKYYDTTTSPEDLLRYSNKALRYAIDHKVHIVNYSGGGYASDRVEKSLIKEMQQKDILLVAASGNNANNTDLRSFYPAGYSYTNIMRIGGLTKEGRYFKKLNYGLHSVHIAFPAEEVLSTLPSGKFGVMSGTSQATAIASFTAAVILSRNRALFPEDVIDLISGLGHSSKEQFQKTKSGTQLDLALLNQNKDPRLSDIRN